MARHPTPQEALTFLSERRGQKTVPALGWGLWNLGFRPFYLLAALLAAVSVPLWVLQFSGWLAHPVFEAASWHAHEMIFGYALAIVIGFLLTASRNWTGRPTPTGKSLMALAILWLLARVLPLSPWVWASLVVNVAVPWATAWALWKVLSAVKNRRNYFFVGWLVIMGGLTAWLHLQRAGVLAASSGETLSTALDVILFIVAVMAGRVVPMFSNNGVPGLGATRNTVVEQLALGSVLLLAGLDALGVQGAGMAAVLFLTMAIHGVRWLLWKPWGTRRNALVWVLHAAYFWLPVHLALRAGAQLQWWMPGAATHALTMGLLGMLTLGMMTRTALGHTGQPLRAGRAEESMYVLVMLAAAIRVSVPLLMPQHTLVAVQFAAVLWSVAFGVYLWRYTPLLTRPRADGQPG